jgi:hypothetical protein
MNADPLHSWLGEAPIRTCNRRRAAASGERLWNAARSVRVGETPRLGRLIRWRIQGTSPGQSFFDLFSAYPFVVLDHGPRLLVSGLCGRIWTLARDYPALQGPDDFRAWRRPGTVRVAFAHSVHELGDHGAELVSEARVEPVDRAARKRLLLTWAVLGRFERLIGGEALAVAARRAEE